MSATTTRPVVLIDQLVESELSEHLHVPLEMQRIAINENQIAEYDLPTKPRKAGERRRLDVKETVEAEAMTRQHPPSHGTGRRGSIPALKSAGGREGSRSVRARCSHALGEEVCGMTTDPCRCTQ